MRGFVRSSWSLCRPPRLTTGHDLSATAAMIVMQPAAGMMEIAMLPALQRSFTRYTLPMESTARQAA